MGDSPVEDMGECQEPASPTGATDIKSGLSAMSHLLPRPPPWGRQ